MTPKEKAEGLVYKFEFSCGGSHEYQVLKNAKQCALIAVDEIIEELIEKDFANRFSYWQEVKHEIEKL
jgi:hypothetical protein